MAHPFLDALWVVLWFVNTNIIKLAYVYIKTYTSLLYKDIYLLYKTSIFFYLLKVRNIKIYTDKEIYGYWGNKK